MKTPEPLRAQTTTTFNLADLDYNVKNRVGSILYS